MLGENTNLVLEFFEIGGGAQVSFDYTQVCLSAYIPTSPTASATGATTASISWAANGNDGSVSYNWAVKNQGGTTISNGTTSGTSASVTGLSANTTYYFTVVATNSCGSSATATSAEFTTFTTPTLAATSSMSVITATTATSGGNVTADGGASVTARGVCWSTTANPTITDSKTTDGSGTGSFTSNLTGLSAGTVYFVRAYATNSVGTAYGSQVSFTYTTSDIQASDFTNPSTVDVVVANGSTFNCNGTDHSYNSITVKPGGHLSLADTKSLNPGSLVLESDATGTATFIDNNTGENPPAITATVKQYLTSGRNWYLSSPITTATTAALSSATSIMYYNEPTASWVTPTSGSTLNPMRGYISVTTNSTGTVNFVGTLNSGPKSISLTRTAGQTKEGFNLVGNPYPSNVSWNDATKTNLENTIWYRTQNQSAAYVFDTYGALTGIGTNNNGNGAVSGSIPAMQSFWVRVSSGKTTGTLAFDNTMRLHGVAGNKLKAPSAINATQKIVRLQVTNGTNSDETILVFNPLASDSYDAYDSPKMSNGSAAIPEIYSKAGSETVAINGMKTFETEKSVALGFNTGQSNTFSIKATEISGFDSDYKIVLYDKELGSEYNLSEILPYQFNSGVVNTLNRFEVRFKAPGITTDINTDKAENVCYSRINNREVLIKYNGLYTGNEMVSIYNATGIKMEMKPVTGSATTITLPYPSGVYIIKFQTDKKINTHKITIN